MALPKWIEDFLSSPAVKELARIFALTVAMALVAWFQTGTITQNVNTTVEQATENVNARTKKSENLVQKEIERQAVAVVSAVTSAPVAEVAPVVEEAAEAVDP